MKAYLKMGVIYPNNVIYSLITDKVEATLHTRDANTCTQKGGHKRVDIMKQTLYPPTQSFC